VAGVRKPCPHALALIITKRNPKMEDYLHPYFSVYHFRIAYGGIIKPLPDKSQWPKVDLGFKVLPPLTKREVGRQWKNMKTGCLENKGNKPRSKGMWQVQCKTCFAFGHRQSSPKCPCNGPKKKYKRCCYTHAFAIACALYLIYFHLQEESCKAREAVRIR
jgi:hypothetical protein